ncbi:diguanylate cyclase [Campylobacter iguaniorum]|nr:diguanylate cyclase [Campylobacter iguaniorum]
MKIKGLLVITITFIVWLIVLVYASVSLVKEQMEQNSFKYLNEATHQLAADLYKTTDMDRTILTAMASIIANESDDNVLSKVLGGYNSIGSYINYVELLRPDNTMLDSNANVRDVSGVLNFDIESKKGAYVSDIVYSTKDPQKRIIRNAIPVVKNGKTIYILYGVVDLTKFANSYKTNIYDGNAYVYLEDGNTGDFLLDTWHKSFGNISDYSDRSVLSKDDFKDAIINMRNGIDGNLSFISDTTGDILYMNYKPVGINNWNVVVTVQDHYALADSRAVNKIMYQMQLMVGISIFIYVVLVIVMLIHSYHSIKKIGLNDKNTGLQNRNAYDAAISNNKAKKFESLACIFIDVNGLHEINNTSGHEKGDELLSYVADNLKEEFNISDIYRAGGDEFIIIIEGMSEETCKAKMEIVNNAINARKYSIAYGISVLKNTTGYSEAIHSADDKMLENKRLHYAKCGRKSR